MRRCPTVRQQSRIEVIDAVGSVRKRHSFFECFSLCLSRACLGKVMHFWDKMPSQKRLRFLTSSQRMSPSERRRAGRSRGACPMLCTSLHRRRRKPRTRSLARMPRWWRCTRGALQQQANQTRQTNVHSFKSLSPPPSCWLEEMNQLGWAGEKLLPTDDKTKLGSGNKTISETDLEWPARQSGRRHTSSGSQGRAACRPGQRPRICTIQHKRVAI
jgi:hypothetical protein